MACRLTSDISTKDFHLYCTPSTNCPKHFSTFSSATSTLMDFLRWSTISILLNTEENCCCYKSGKPRTLEKVEQAKFSNKNSCQARASDSFVIVSASEFRSTAFLPLTTTFLFNLSTSEGSWLENLTPAPFRIYFSRF